jgi:hypothetical protein
MTDCETHAQDILVCRTFYVLAFIATKKTFHQLMNCPITNTELFDSAESLLNFD